MRWHQIPSGTEYVKSLKYVFFLSHRSDQNYWKNMDVETWKDEMVGMRKIIGQFAAIDPCQVTGNNSSTKPMI